LTDAQKTQASAIFEEAQTASSSLRETQAQQRTALNDAAKSNAADAAIDQLAATLGAKVTRIHLIVRGFIEPCFLLLAALTVHAFGGGLLRGCGPPGPARGGIRPG